MRTVYMITGFLDSGKSEFLTYTLEQPYFQIKGKTLLILCEEGEVEYSPQLLENSRTEVEIIENEEDFNADNLLKLDKKHKPERIIVEFNGMWNYKNIKLPWSWKVEQQITTIDASTFPVYYNNMKSLVTEMIRKSDMIIFNRCDSVIDDLGSYKRNIKAVNQKADVVFEGSEGEINTIFEEDLPYDINKEHLDLDNYGYGIFYIDSMDNVTRYMGKTVTFIAQVMKPQGMEKNCFVPGRLAMTCCADDMAFLGYVCEYDLASTLSDKDWVKVTARIYAGARPEYEGQTCVIYKEAVVEKIAAPAPKDQVISFN